MKSLPLWADPVVREVASGEKNVLSGSDRAVRGKSRESDQIDSEAKSP